MLPTPEAAEFAQALAKTRLDRVVAEVSRTRKTVGVDEIHDLRVAIRRFSQIPVVFGPLFPPKESKRVRRTLKKIMGLAGRVRDLDIAIAQVRKSRVNGTADLLPEFRRQRKSEAKMLRAKLHNWTPRCLPSGWTPPSAEPVTIEDRANQTLPRLIKRFFGLGNRATHGKAGHLEALHEVRIAAKKLRYTLELFIPLQPDVVQERVERLKNVQSMLGSMNDLEIVRTLVSEITSKDTGQKLVAELTKRRDRRVDEFIALWRGQFAGADREAQWKNELARWQKAPRKPAARSESVRRLAEESA